jgi:hypothetical protein
MNLMFRGSVSIGSILTDDGNVIESASVSQPLAAGASNVHWQGAGEVPAESDVLLELDALPQQAFGDEGAVGLASIHAVYLRNTGAVDLEVGGWQQLVGVGHLTLRPGGLLVITAPSAGFPVASGDCLSLNNASSAAAAYEILLVGVRA